MYIPPTEHPLLDCSVWWHFISAWAFIAYSYRKGLAGTSRKRISKGKVPRFFYNYTNGAFGANFPKETKLHEKVILISTKSVLM